MNERWAAKARRNTQDLNHARKLIGQRVSALLHDQYYFNDEKCQGDKGSIQWQSGEHLTVSMYLLNDGESVGADLLPLKAPICFELEPGATCTWRREDLLVELSATHLLSRVITEVQGIVDTWPNRTDRLVGFKIVFETGDFVIFLNQGDEAVVLVNELPPEVEGIGTSCVSSVE